MKLINVKNTIFLLILIFVFSSIGLAEANRPRPVNINILMPAPFVESTLDLVSRFNDKEKGKINLKITKGPLETEAVSDLAISSLLLGKSTFDALLIDVTWLPKYAAAGWLEPFEDRIKPKDWDSLAAGARLGNKYMGRIYRWPLVADMGLLYWRTDLMDEPPKTEKELLDISLNLREQGKVPYGYVWQGRQYEGLSCVFLEVINGFGGEWLSSSMKVNLTSKESLEATRWLKELITSGASPRAVMNFSETEALQAFKSGDAALMRNWPYAWEELQKKESYVKGKVGVTTMISKENHEPSATLGSWGFSILKSSTKKDAVFKAIEYLTSENAQKEMFITNGYTPTKSDIFKDEELLASSELLPVLETALSISASRPQTPLYAQISDVLQKQLSSVLTEDKPIYEALKQAEVKTMKIISAAGNKL